MPDQEIRKPSGATQLMSEAIAYYRTIMDTMPMPVLVVDEDLRIFDYNVAAEKLVPGGRELVLGQRAGEAMNCSNATKTPGGCGRSAVCPQCVIRNSVGCAMAGVALTRQATRMELLTEHSARQVILLVTAAPMEVSDGRRVLLVLENLSDLARIHCFSPGSLADRPTA